jgi:hypothetical protein
MAPRPPGLPGPRLGDPVIVPSEMAPRPPWQPERQGLSLQCDGRQPGGDRHSGHIGAADRMTGSCRAGRPKDEDGGSLPHGIVEAVCKALSGIHEQRPTPAAAHWRPARRFAHSQLPCGGLGGLVPVCPDVHRPSLACSGRQHLILTERGRNWDVHYQVVRPPTNSH